MKGICLLSGTAAVLGVYLYFYGAGAVRWIGLSVLATSVAAILLCIYISKKSEKNIYNLHGQIMDFLEGRDKTPAFSVNDDTFALFENAVVELENRLLLERDNTKRECKKNTDFITDISHQLKTPLAALKLYCEMDYHHNPAEHAQTQLVLLEHMEHLIYSLLRLEKLRNDAYEMQFTTRDLAELARQVWEELQLLYPEKNFEIRGKAAMRCDGYWMGEALKNILKNSCEHTATDGKIQLLLEVADSSVMVTVKDNGGGIPEEELPRLFQRFYRSSRAASNGGTGIGLAITKTIVEKHHGTIYAENTTQGLKITLCFPIFDGILPIG